MIDVMSVVPTGENAWNANTRTLDPVETRNDDFIIDPAERSSFADRLRNSRLAQALALVAAGASIGATVACGPSERQAGSGTVATAPGAGGEILGNQANIVASLIEATPAQQESKLSELRAMTVEQIMKLSPADQAAWMAYYMSSDIGSFIKYQADTMPIYFLDPSLVDPSNPGVEFFNRIDPQALVEDKDLAYATSIQQAAYLLSNAGHLDEQLFKSICGATLTKESSTYAKVVKFAELHPVADGASFEEWLSKIPNYNFVHAKEGTAKIQKISKDIWEVSVVVTDELGDEPHQYTLTYRYFNTGAVIKDTSNAHNPGGETLQIIPLGKAGDDAQLGPMAFGMLVGDPK